MKPKIRKHYYARKSCEEYSPPFARIKAAQDWRMDRKDWEDFDILPAMVVYFDAKLADYHVFPCLAVVDESDTRIVDSPPLSIQENEELCAVAFELVANMSLWQKFVAYFVRDRTDESFPFANQ